MVISCKLMGGLGNNLFQICCVLAYSLKYNCDYCIGTVIENPHSQNQKVFYSNNLKYCEYGVGGYTSNIVYTEPYFHYKEIPKYDCDKVFFSGYFQSHKYFNEYREEILKILGIHSEFKKGYVAIHWRLGDYRKLQNFHPPVTIDYIQKGIDLFIGKGYNKFIVFSDDIDFCFDNIKVRDDISLGFSYGRTDVEDLSLASSCEHNIGSNSSFSWWIYYLNRNENKIGVFPKKSKWFGESLTHNVDDLYMHEFVLI